MPLAIYKEFCPNCGGEIEAERLEKGLACSKCIPDEISETELCEILARKSELKNYSWVCCLKSLERQFCDFFTKNLGFEPWALQRLWAKRVLSGESFTLIAPTGVGKTTFGIAMANFLPGKAYILLPTRLLVEQVAERCKTFKAKKVVAYTGKTSERKTIEAGDYEILVTTNMFLATNFELVQDQRFSFIFVDDVDSLLKSGKNIDRVLKLLGFTDEEISQAWQKVSGKLLEEKEEETMEEEEENILEESSQEDEFNEENVLQTKGKGILVVSSATLKPKTQRVKLFKSLLGFNVTPVKLTIRNVCDAVEWVDGPQQALYRLADWIRFFGKGGLVFVNREMGKDGVTTVVDFLKQQGINVSSYEELDLESMRNGLIDVAVGIATYNNALVRGVDLPEVIRYAIFIDSPKISFAIEQFDNPRNFVPLLLALREVVEDKSKIDLYLERLRRYQVFKFEKQLPKPLLEIAEYLRKNLNDESIVEKLEKAETIGLQRKEGKLFITFGDAANYLQASGRTSRLYPGGISRGISLILVWDKKAFHSLVQRLRLFYEEVDFLSADQVNWEEELKNVDADRKKIREIKKQFKPSEQLSLKSTLVIVESPNKARTISHFFGVPQQRILNGLHFWEILTGDRLLSITASIGHTVDLIEREEIYGVSKANGHFVPIYSTIKTCSKCGQQTTSEICSCGKQPDKDKLTLIKALQQVAPQFDEIIIATDPDMEGEKIGYDLMVALKPFNSNIVRAEFHEVTRQAFLKALNSPRELSKDLVKAQITRRILDRWVGFYLSQELWKAFKKYNLSAGRVQTPVLGWVIDRTNSARQKKAKLQISVKSILEGKTAALIYEHEDINFAKQLVSMLQQAQVTLEDVGQETENPPAPYNTASLLSEMGAFASAVDIMNTLQELFEQGLITYHRTTSTRVSQTGIKLAEEFLKQMGLHQIFHPRTYGTEGAHECIRPTKLLNVDDLKLWIHTGRVKFENQNLALQLYGRILNRFLASQSAPAVVQKSKLTIKLPDWSYEWTLTTKIIEPGFRTILPAKVFDLKPPLKVVWTTLRLVAKELPFTQGSLVQQMRERGLGRPSTYATIVQTLLDRKYVEERNGYLYATPLGYKVYHWLRTNYPQLTDESLTRKMEDVLDEIEAGNADYQSFLSEFYRDFLQKVFENKT
ncbi:reverse gyrase [Pseudothermotoga thermarum]|uniref:Reverse gyrase n=1 Tax=Pseudothermotoga thermarum DSM 5069 TaxID=688269 RepID=F7YYT1_9THEM|nr:reverse gyrase [Pseudothermotoga thermarum]AEH51119.1 reverse gyrase [Pseudothermotoga thermarum DSM 5069]